MEAAGAAKTEQRKVSGVVSTLNRDQPNRLLHVVVYDVNHTLGELHRSLPRNRPRELAKSRSDPIDCKGHGPSQEKLREQAAEDDVRVGDCKALANAVAYWTGNRARAFRSHFQRPAGVEFGD